MADNSKPMIRGWPGLIAAGLVAALTLGTLCAVALRADGWGGLGPADWSAIRFTLLQAFLSAACSVALAIPVARALARRSFRGKALLVTILGAPFILPVIVAVLGLLAVFGRGGILNATLDVLGLPQMQIYGLHGVVLAHVFFNMPLATRLILQGWLAIPAERFRLAASLNLTTQQINRQLEHPMLRNILPGAFMAIFVLCTTSFAVVLALGGGPKATTVELAIYQAFRFDFDLGRAALLGIVQFAICGVGAAIMFWVHVPEDVAGGLDRPVVRWDIRSGPSMVFDWMWVTLATVFLMVPLAMIVLRGLPGLLDLPPSVFGAALRSLGVAIVSAMLAVCLALPMALAMQDLRSRTAAKSVEVLGYLAIAASPLVIGTGLFIVLFPIANPIALALPVTALVNAVMSLPFALRSLVPAVTQVSRTYGRLGDSLGLTGFARLRLLYLPRLRRPLGFSAGLAAALSMGDLGVIALFADPDAATLPLQLYRLMSAYRMDQAAGVALVLLSLSLALFWAFDRGGRVDADA